MTLEPPIHGSGASGSIPQAASTSPPPQQHGAGIAFTSVGDQNVATTDMPGAMHVLGSGTPSVIGSKIASFLLDDVLPGQLHPPPSIQVQTHREEEKIPVTIPNIAEDPGMIASPIIQSVHFVSPPAPPPPPHPILAPLPPMPPPSVQTIVKVSPSFSLFSIKHRNHYDLAFNPGLPAPLNWATQKIPLQPMIGDIIAEHGTITGRMLGVPNPHTTGPFILGFVSLLLCAGLTRLASALVDNALIRLRKKLAGVNSMSTKASALSAWERFRSRMVALLDSILEIEEDPIMDTPAPPEKQEPKLTRDEIPKRRNYSLNAGSQMRSRRERGRSTSSSSSIASSSSLPASFEGPGSGHLMDMNPNPNFSPNELHLGGSRAVQSSQGHSNQPARRDTLSSLKIWDNPFLTPLIISEWQTPRDASAHSPRSITNKSRRALFIGKAAQGAAAALQQLQLQQQVARQHDKNHRFSQSKAASAAHPMQLFYDPSSNTSSSSTSTSGNTPPSNAPLPTSAGLLGVTAYAQRKLAGLAALRGYLEKRARTSLVGWQVRWFETHHAYLRYYHTEDRKNGLCMIDLRNVLSVEHGSKAGSPRSSKLSPRGREFRIVTPERTYRLRAETTADAKVWVAHLKLRQKVLKQYCSEIKWPNNRPVTPRIANDDLALGYASVTTSMIAHLASSSYLTSQSNSPPSKVPVAASATLTPSLSDHSMAGAETASSSGSTETAERMSLTLSRISPASSTATATSAATSTAPSLSMATSNSLAVSSVNSSSLIQSLSADLPKQSTSSQIREFTPEEKSSIAWSSLEEARQRLASQMYNALPESTCSMLMRFLAARAWDYDEAYRLLQQHLQWRKENLPIPAEEVREELAKEKYSLLGTDKLGRRIIIIFERRLGKHTYTNLEACTKALIFGLERLFKEKLGPTEQFVVIFNRLGSTKSNVDLDWARVVGGILQNNYPERLGAAFVAPANLIFRGIWRIASLFFDPKTANKIKLLGTTTQLLEYIDEDQLLDELGGTLPYRFDIEESLGYRSFTSPRLVQTAQNPVNTSKKTEFRKEGSQLESRAKGVSKMSAISEAGQHPTHSLQNRGYCNAKDDRGEDEELRLQRKLSTGSASSSTSIAASSSASTNSLATTVAASSTSTSDHHSRSTQLDDAGLPLIEI